MIYNVIIYPCIYQPLPSDYHIISFRLTLSVNATSKRPSLFSFDYYKADLNIPVLNIGCYVCECFSDVESVWRFIKNSIMEGMNMYISKIRK